MPPRRRLHRHVVEQQHETTLAFGRMRALIEALAQLRPDRAPHGLGGIERPVFDDFGENIAHQIYVIVRRNN